MRRRKGNRSGYDSKLCFGEYICNKKFYLTALSFLLNITLIIIVNSKSNSHHIP